MSATTEHLIGIMNAELEVGRHTIKQFKTLLLNPKYWSESHQDEATAEELMEPLFNGILAQVLSFLRDHDSETMNSISILSTLYTEDEQK